MDEYLDYYSLPRLRAFDYFALFVTVFVPGMIFIWTGEWQFLVAALVFGYPTAVTSGTTDWEESHRFAFDPL